MPGLPHWNNSQAAINLWEPLYLNQFEVVITPPPSITQGVNLLVEHIKNLDGLPELSASGTLVKQYYKFAERTYAPAKPESTTTILTIQFEVNLNDANDMYIYNTIRAWFDLSSEPMTGRQGLKRDYGTGEIYVAIFNRIGDIYREYRFKPCMPTGKLTQMKLDYSADGQAGIYVLTAQFEADAWVEDRIGSIGI